MNATVTMVVSALLGCGLAIAVAAAATALIGDAKPPAVTKPLVGAP